MTTTAPETKTKKQTYGSGTGTSHLYAIEARTTYFQPQVVNGMILTNDWQRVHVQCVDGGRLAFMNGLEVAALASVPAGQYETPHARSAGLVEREQATLLAARFQMESNGRVALCVETRLVEVKLQYSYATEEVGVCEPFSLFTATRWLKSTPRADAAIGTGSSE